MSKAKEKKPVGRPKFEINEEVLKRTEQLMAQGLTREQCARALGISVATFYNYQAQNLEFLEAIKRGESLGIEEVTNALFHNATVDRDNTAIIFFLKNRAGWVDKQEHKVETENRVTLDLTRIGVDELSAIERAFEQSHLGSGQSGEIPQIIEGVYESSVADD